MACHTPPPSQKRKKAVIWFGQSVLGASLGASDLVPILLVGAVPGHSLAPCLFPVPGRLRFPSGTALPGGAFISCGAGCFCMSEKYFISIAEGCFHCMTSSRFTVLLVISLYLGHKDLLAEGLGTKNRQAVKARKE